MFCLYNFLISYGISQMLVPTNIRNLSSKRPANGCCSCVVPDQYLFLVTIPNGITKRS